MSFQHTLEGLFNKGKAKLDELVNNRSQSQPQPQYQQQYQQQYQPQYQSQYQSQQYQPQSGGHPPPIPSSTKPQRASYPFIPTSTRPSPSPPYWQANFNPQTPISQIFQQETGAHGWGNAESQNYTTDPQNCFFTPDHKLVLRAVCDPSPENRYTSARLISHQKLDRQRGSLSATLTVPCAPGIWPAFWLLPSQPFTWPNDGEIDIFESWNGDCVNHSCLHWGHYNGEDWDKHRVVETPITDMGQIPHTFELAWDQPESGVGGKLVWYIDGSPVMKAGIPQGVRRISDWKVILNIAMGGNVCGGRLPENGLYDLVVHELKMTSEPTQGWEKFAADWEMTREGKTM
jgi:Glycosyl hydrolases family 16